MTTVANIPGTRLLNQLSSYPLLNDTYNQAASYYTWAKAKSPYVAAPLSLAENGLKKAVETSQPVLQKFNGQLNMAEDIACSKLAQMETRYPVVLKPTKEIYVDSKEYLESSIQPLVQKAVSPISSTYSSVKEYGSKTVENLSHTGIASRGYTLLEQAVDTADIYADKFLPAEDEEKRPAGKKDLLSKTMGVSTKVQRRMYSKAMKGLQHMKVRSDESLKKLHFTVDLMEYAKTQMSGVKGRFDDICEEISQEYAEEVKQEVEEDKTADESVVLNKARSYANTLRLTALATSSVFYRHLSEDNQIRLTKAKKYSEELYAQLVQSKTFADLSDAFFVHSRKTLKYVQDTLDTTFKYLLQLKAQYLSKQKTVALQQPKKIDVKDDESSSSGEDSDE